MDPQHNDMKFLPRFQSLTKLCCSSLWNWIVDMIICTSSLLLFYDSPLKIFSQFKNAFFFLILSKSVWIEKVEIYKKEDVSLLVSICNYEFQATTSSSCITLFSELADWTKQNSQTIQPCFVETWTFPMIVTWVIAKLSVCRRDSSFIIAAAAE